SIKGASALWQRCAAEREESTLPIQRNLGVKNQRYTNSGNDQPNRVAPNPPGASQSREEREQLRREHGNDRDKQEPPMLKEGEEPVAFSLIIHGYSSGLTVSLACRLCTRACMVDFCKVACF